MYRIALRISCRSTARHRPVDDASSSGLIRSDSSSVRSAGYRFFVLLDARHSAAIQSAPFPELESRPAASHKAFSNGL